MFGNPYAERLSEFPTIVQNLQQPRSRTERAEPYPLRGNWSAFFQERLGFLPRKIIFEIGCLNAHYLARIAEVQNRSAFVGVDWKFKAIYNGARSIHKKALQNIFLLRGHSYNVEQFFKEGEVDEVWLFFPDPWPKKAQKKNRIVQKEFLNAISRILKPAGRLFIKTDHADYFQWITTLIKQNERLQMRQHSEDFWKEREGLLLNRGKQEIPFFWNEKTVFEKDFCKEGLPIFFLEVEPKA